MFGLPNFITPDGAQLVFQNGGDLYLLALNGEAAASPLLSSEFQEFFANISPDGRWMAYTSDETGRYEVYVRPFPNVDDNKFQVSSQGGYWPRWNSDGTELFFLTQGLEMSIWAVSVETESDFEYGIPSILFAGDYARISTTMGFDLSPDGTRFLLTKLPARTDSAEDPNQTTLIVVDNWFEELNRLAPPSP